MSLLVRMQTMKWSGIGPATKSCTRFEKLWPEVKTQVYFKKLLRHLVILLIEFPHLSLTDIRKLLKDAAFRTSYTERLRNTESRDFWRLEYDSQTPSQQDI